MIIILQSNTEVPYHDVVIKSCSTPKLLDVTVNNSMSWKDHIETVIKTCNTYLNILSRIKLYLSTQLHTLPGAKPSKTAEKCCPSNSWL